MSTSERRLRALRGATTVASDDAEAVVQGTAALLREMLDRNRVDEDDLVSVIFTATPDLTSEFPAAAARSLGIGHVPLLCSQELDVTGAVPRCVRVLMHLYTERDPGDLHHVYLGDARRLRTDLPR